MPTTNPIKKHLDDTRRLALSLNKADVYHWLVEYGYFPESYVLPPCFSVAKRPRTKVYYKVKEKGTKYKPKKSECVKVHYPKSALTDREFGLIDPTIHNDIAFHIASNWADVVEAMLPKNSVVTPYAFPVPISERAPGRVGYLRAGRMIYEFISMTEDDLASVAYKYTYIFKTDIKNFYPSCSTSTIIPGQRQLFFPLGRRC